jgi:hypothetical protein
MAPLRRSPSGGILVPALFVLAAVGAIVGTTLIEPYFSYNRFATTGPYTATPSPGAQPAREGWPTGSGSGFYPLEVGAAVCGPVNGTGIGPAPVDLLPDRFRRPTTPVLVFLVTCSSHDMVRVECRGPTDCLAVEDRSIGRILVPVFGAALALLLLMAAWVVATHRGPARRWIGVALILLTTIAVSLTQLRSEMSLACDATDSPCYPPPSFLDLPIRLGIEIAVIALALPLLRREGRRVPSSSALAAK